MDKTLDNFKKTNNLDAFWMPFTYNRAFKKAPRMLVDAKDMHYITDDGRKVLDGAAGLWCVNAGHKRDKIVKAIQKQAEGLDYAPAFQLGHPHVFELAAKLTTITPGDLDYVFFTNSGSESVDTALKIALAYHRVRGEGQRFRLIGREKAYHGVGFGGIAVGGLGRNRSHFGPLLPGVDHLRHTLDLERNAFSKGLPRYGKEFADDLERLTELHDAHTIAAVIVEPVIGSAGVIPPPQGYLERLRALCTKHNILLIFDEVITGFGRLGAPFAADYFGVMPDILVTAKGLSNGAVPMGAVFVKSDIYNAFMKGPEEAIELFHGYTYSGHPLACAAAMATLEVYQEENLFKNAKDLSNTWQNAIHALKECPYVIDIRNLGLMGAIQLQSIPDHIGKRAYHVFCKAYEMGAMVRFTGDTIALSPPLMINEQQIVELMSIIEKAIRTLQ